MNQKDIGQFILKLRLEKKLTQQQLAKLIPVTRQAVSRWEQGKSTPDSQTLIHLSEIFDISINELLSGERKEITVQDEKNNLESLALKMFDKKNKIERKAKKYIFISILIILLLISLFLFYYFFATYDSVKIFTVSAEGKNATMENGIFITTKQKNYLKLSTIEEKENKKIKYLHFYYYDKNKNHKINLYEGKSKNILLTDYYGYNENFSWDKFNKIKNNFFIDLKYNNNEKETLKLIFDFEMSNNKFYFVKRDKDFLENKIYTKNSVNKIMNDVKNKVIKEGKKETNFYCLNFSENFNITYYPKIELLIFKNITNKTQEVYKYYIRNKKNSVINYTIEGEKDIIKEGFFSNLNVCESKEKNYCMKFKFLLNKYVFKKSN